MKQITFATEATTVEATRYIVIYLWVIIRNTALFVNRMVYRYPWIFIIAVMLLSVLLSFIFIGEARAERDSYNQQLSQVMLKLESAQNAITSE